MTTFTIHAEENLAEALRSGAVAAGASINVFIKNKLTAALGLAKADRAEPSFMRFAGSLDAATAKKMQASVKEAAFSQIDPGDWE